VAHSRRQNINKDGIAPDVEAEYSNEDYKAGKDPQLDKALEIVKGGSQRAS
jgi:C-terminal processing protease CtpA/Prc